MKPKPDPIAELARLFPQAFFVDGARRRPLKFGIYEDIVKRNRNRATGLRNALTLYVNSEGYLRATRAGAPRIDLGGVSRSFVTRDEEAWAVEQLTKKFLRAAEQKSNAGKIRT
jgi:sRNA-binding protein